MRNFFILLVCVFSQISYANCNNSRGTSAVEGYICKRYDQLSWVKVSPVEAVRAQCNIPAVKFFCSVGETIGSTTNYYQYFNPDLAGSCTGPLITSGTMPYTFTFVYEAQCEDEPTDPSD